MRCALSVKIVLFHHALKTLAFRAADNIHIIARLKLRDVQIDLAFRRINVQPKFADEFLRLRAGFLKLSQQLLCDARFLLRTEPDLHGRIAIVLVRYATQKTLSPAAITVTGCSLP